MARCDHHQRSEKKKQIPNNSFTHAMKLRSKLTKERKRREKAEEELKKERERRERAEVIAEGIKEAYNNLFRDYERCKDALADWERRFTTEVMKNQW
ncbi:13725_t:CDS:2 [Ambispora leptoticha]|uniref:13725_t:CDS:1 n=1 Tax=Ambispora leptoticha TaxID=144679 RepID=A0A9N9EPX9_9GLOM|nr:13725_t:CDS:2 [Ambispora leptoticha]